jgi:glycosyltransferase involved in cell wall biosynthesis
MLSRLRLGRAMGKKMAGLKPDAIFLPGNFHAFLAPALRAACPQAVLMLKISNPPLPGGIAGALAAPFFRHLAKALDGIAAMSKGLARDVAQIAPNCPVTALRDPVQVSFAPPDLKHKRDQVLQILWIGRLEPQKDISLALHTLVSLLREQSAHLTILGDGAEREAMLMQIARLNLGSAVTWQGHVADIAPYLAAADCLLITSRYEGGPAVAVEALAKNVPLVSTDCSHMLHDLVTIPEAGRLVPSRDPDALASALRAVAAQPSSPQLAVLVRDYAPDVCARAYLDWFDHIAAARIERARTP